MSIHYGPADGEFSDSSFMDAPEGSVEITSERHKELLDGQTEGLVIFTQEDGLPGLRPRPAATDAELRGNALRERDWLLSIASLRVAPLQDAVDTDQATDAELASLKAWKAYRIALGRIESVEGFPASFEWPEPPASLS